MKCWRSAAESLRRQVAAESKAGEGARRKPGSGVTQSVMGANAEASIENFEYPACPGMRPEAEWQGWEEPGTAQAQGDAVVDAHGVGWEERLAEEARRAFEAGCERGREEGCRAEREAQAAAIRTDEEQRRRRLAAQVEQFAEERDRYLHAVEQEVVKLALAVAARILRREAQMDPLLLTGAVRVALGQLAAATEVRLLVPEAEVGLWRETMAHLPHLAVKPVVEAGEGMRLGDCVIESKVGTVDLGVRSQLGEIERGFFDRSGGTTTQATDSQDGPARADAI